jgi:hypothetical protein
LAALAAPYGSYLLGDFGRRDRAEKIVGASIGGALAGAGTGYYMDEQERNSANASPAPASTSFVMATI